RATAHPPGWSSHGRHGRRARRCAGRDRSRFHLRAGLVPPPRALLVGVVVVVIVLVERDAVLLRDSGVLVVLRRAMVFLLTGSEPEGFRPRLLQLARFFEAAMTTLFHGRAPTSVR